METCDWATWFLVIPSHYFLWWHGIHVIVHMFLHLQCGSLQAHHVALTWLPHHHTYDVWHLITNPTMYQISWIHLTHGNLPCYHVSMLMSFWCHNDFNSTGYHIILFFFHFFFQILELNNFCIRCPFDAKLASLERSCQSLHIDVVFS